VRARTGGRLLGAPHGGESGTHSPISPSLHCSTPRRIEVCRFTQSFGDMGADSTAFSCRATRGRCWRRPAVSFTALQASRLAESSVDHQAISGPSAVEAELDASRK